MTEAPQPKLAGSFGLAGNLCLGLALLVSCGSPTPAQSAVPPTHATPTQAAPRASNDSAVVWQRRVDEQLPEVAKLRGLAVKQRVQAEALTRDQMAARATDKVASEYPQSFVDAQEAMLVLLGVAPLGFDFIEATRLLLTANLAGFYDPESKTMVVGSDLPEQELEIALIHELVHALQDQHYGLNQLMGYQQDRGDWQTAMHALAEGDATSAMFDAAMGGRGDSTDLPEEALAFQMRASIELVTDPAVPSIIRQSAIAPYIDGLVFVQHLRRQGGWELVNQAWSRGLASTEQLLHPEKWQTGELPVVVPAPGPPTRSAKLEFRDVVGEQAFRLLLAEWLPRAVAEQAASGWAGDRVSVYSEGGAHWLAWRLRFDEAEAPEAAMALYRGLWDAPKGASLPDAAVCRSRADRPPIGFARRGTDFVVVAGGEPGRCEPLLRWVDTILAMSD